MTVADGVELVEAFVNTRSLSSSRDSIAAPAALVSWLAERALLEPGARATARDVAAAQELREALRALLLANNEAADDVGDALEVVNATAARARFTLAFGAWEARPEPRAGGVAGALGRILAAVAAAMADGTWSRLKACRADDCQWAFYDRAKNRSRAWCSMQSCGNREKARAFRERHSH